MSAHSTHCCKIHGCKYGDDNCPVYNGDEKGIICEDCLSDYENPDKAEIIKLKQQRDYLLSAMKNMRPFIEEGDVPKCYWSEPFSKALYEFDEAIAKAEA